MRYSKIGFCSIFLLLLAVQAVTANEIVVEGDGNPSYLTFVGSTSNGISAFGVEIRCSNGTQVTAVESVEPFEVVSGIDTTNGTVKIGGYASQNSQTAVSSQIRLAKVWSAHSIEGVIIVDYLEDFQRSPIQVSNQVSISPTPIGTSVPVYSPPTTYNSPGAVQPNPTDYISAPETVTQSSPNPQVSTSETPSPMDTVRDGIETQTTSSDTVPLTEHSEIVASEPTVSPTRAPLMLYTPFCAIFSALLLIKRREKKVR